MTAPLRLAAPAKLNLYLHITGKRADGYHLLDGLVAFAEVYDTLALSPADSLRFSADGPFAAELGDMSANLVVRAARALGTAVGREPQIALHLTKRLPVASGIGGGGSADAAACLRGLAALWGMNPGGQIVQSVAEGLGADVPACVAGRVGFIGGIGAELASAPKMPPAWLVLANPGIALATPDVYCARTGAFSPPMRFDDAPSDAASLAACLASRGNDLTAPALTRVPEIGNVLAALQNSAGCLLSRMSGSGATCFGIYADAKAARRAAVIIGQNHAGWWVTTGRLLDDTTALSPA